MGEKAEKKWFYLLIALNHNEDDIKTCFAKSQNILDSLHMTINQLEKIGIYILSRGTLEHYMPSFQGDIYKPKSTAKSNALDKEIQWLSEKHNKDEIKTRYGDLVRIVQHLPAKYKVDLEPKIKDELAQLLVLLMTGINKGSIVQISDIPNVIEQRQWLHLQTLFEVKQIELFSPNNFIGEVIVKDCFGLGTMICRFSQNSNPTNPASLNLEKYDA